MPDTSNPSQTPKPLGTLAVVVRLAAIGVIMALCVGGFAYAGGWLTPGRLTPARFIAVLEASAGAPHTGFRRNHAKGVCVSGYFDATGQAVRVSKAGVFAAGRVPVTGRFALAGTQPYMPDMPNTPRSMALRFVQPDGEEWRTGMNNIPVFIVRTPEDFYAELVASAPDPATGKPDPAKMSAFMTAHPEMGAALKQIMAQKPTAGFGDARYNSLDAFRLVDAGGNGVPVRWSMIPLQPASAPATPEPQDKNYLFDALIDQVAKGPLKWRLALTLGQPGDPTGDATIAWPEGRETIDAGTLTIDHVDGESDGACRDVNFDPLVLPAGIAPSDDPLLSARSAAYAKSYTRRSGEPKEPSAVTTEPKP